MSKRALHIQFASIVQCVPSVETQQQFSFLAACSRLSSNILLGIRAFAPFDGIRS